MKIKVFFFGYLSDLTGTNETVLEIAATDRLGDVVRRVKEHFPQLATMGNSVRFAINAEYGSEDLSLSEGDVLSFIPPVSGG
ncbi:MAG: hypothetical protein A2Z34_05065 [Planctomycetes bacterium RBG_16_59_8]|nr:MAG: hypothetical protein A2Z34_05065 [Planctomycetes bacterium RBG_16_59_8]